MNTAIDILTDIKDCNLIKRHSTVNGDKVLIYFIHDLAAVGCTACGLDLALYHIIVVTETESTDICADLCDACLKTVESLCELAIPIRIVH